MAIVRGIRLAALLAAAGAPGLAVAEVAGRCDAAGGARAGVCKELLTEPAAGVELLQTASLRRGDAQAASASALAAPAAAPRKREEQIPGWNDLMDSASAALNSTVNSISESVNSIAGSVNTSSITGTINSVTGSLANASSITDALDAVTGSLGNASSITDAINSVVNNASATITSKSGALADSAAIAVAGALNQTLTALGAQADTFMAACEQEKDSLLAQMNKTKADAAARMAILEANATAVVNDALPQWDLISAAVVSSASLASMALDSVGLSELSAKLNTSLTAALAEANSMTVSLRNVSGLFANISNLAEQELSKQLALVQDTLQTGLELADSFARNLSVAFGDLTDEAAAKIVATIPGANATAIDAIFDAVDEKVAEVAAKIVSGLEVLVSGLSEATGLVEDTLPQGRSSAHRVQNFALAALSTLLGMMVFGL